MKPLIFATLLIAPIILTDATGAMLCLRPEPDQEGNSVNNGKKSDVTCEKEFGPGYKAVEIRAPCTDSTGTYYYYECRRVASGCHTGYYCAPGLQSVHKCTKCPDGGTTQDRSTDGDNTCSADMVAIYPITDCYLDNPTSFDGKGVFIIETKCPHK